MNVFKEQEMLLDDMDQEIRNNLVDKLVGKRGKEVKEIAKNTIVEIINKYAEKGLDIQDWAVEDVAEEYASDIYENFKKLLGGVQ